MIRSSQYMDEMNVAANLKHLGMKLPFKLRGKWSTAACELQERWGNRATFPSRFCPTQSLETSKIHRLLFLKGRLSLNPQNP